MATTRGATWVDTGPSGTPTGTASPAMTGIRGCGPVEVERRGRDGFQDRSGEEVGIRADAELERVGERELAEVLLVEEPVLDELPRLPDDPGRVGGVPVADV